MMDRKPNDRFNFRELSNTLREPLKGSSNLIEDVPNTTTLSLLDARKSLRNERIVRTPGRFMFLGESVSDEIDLDPSSYNKAIFDKDS